MIKRTHLILALLAIIAAVLGSITSMKAQRTEWPELEGVDADLAVRTIRKENPDLNVIKVPSDSGVILDYRLDRVWLWYDKITNLVKGIPKIG